MKSYLRFLSRNKLYTAIMAVGLSVSLAFVIIMSCFVWQNMSVNRYYPDQDRMYAIGTKGSLMSNAYMAQTMVDAIPSLVTEKSIKMFEKLGVLSEKELHSRAEINYELYAKAINIEAKTMIDMATKQIIPAVIRYTTVLGESINTVKTAGEGLIDVSVQLDLLKKASKLLKAANSAMSKLSKLVEKIPEYAEGRDRAVFCREKVVPAMEALREPVDELEMIVDKEMWPMPSYGDLVFEV